MLNVAIAVDSATDYGPRAVEVVAAACEEVIGAQRCPVAGELQAGAVAAWYAVVHPSDRGLGSVRIEFRDRTADGVLIEVRSLTFSAHDQLESRLMSVGSVIAALAAAREGVVLKNERAAPAPLAPAPLDQPVPVAPHAPDWSLDFAALAAPALGGGPYRLGAFGRAQFGLLGGPFALVAARFAEHPGNPNIDWWAVSAGVGTRLGERTSLLNLELSSEVVLQYTDIAAERGSARESAGRTGWGGRVGVAAVWANWRHCSAIVGVDGTVVLPRIQLVVGNDVTHVPLTSLGLSLGLRFQP